MMNLFKRFMNFEKRALQISDVSMRFYELIEQSTDMWDLYEYPYVLNHFIDGDGSYLVFTARGKLYKVRYISDGFDVTFQEPVEVVIEFTEVSRGLKLRRTKNNKLSFYAIASAAVLNRIGEIDSTLLFDSFVESFNSPQPLNFYHIQDPKFRMGDIVGIERDGNLLIIWGYIDESTKLGRYAAKRFEKGDYGISIEFFSRKQEVLKVAETDILVHTEGLFVGAAALKEEDAASYMTAIGTV